MVFNYRDEYCHDQDYEKAYDDVDNNKNQVRKDELDLTTRLLCDIMKELKSEEFDRDSDMCFVNKYLLKKIPDLKQWWEKHQKVDKKKK